MSHFNLLHKSASSENISNYPGPCNVELFPSTNLSRAYSASEGYRQSWQSSLERRPESVCGQSTSSCDISLYYPRSSGLEDISSRSSWSVCSEPRYSKKGSSSDSTCSSDFNQYGKSLVYAWRNNSSMVCVIKCCLAMFNLGNYLVLFLCHLTQFIQKKPLWLHRFDDYRTQQNCDALQIRLELMHCHDFPVTSPMLHH
jgi:hypothetical protein